jgi:lipopolysaccharide transport system ATP-binding protein
MQARLTFAVATSVDPDVLIIDEALAVGDNRFQLKSFDRVRDFKRRGKSILLVTHDIGQIVSICDRAILLERGRVIADGNPDEVGNLYHELLFGPPEGHAEAGPAKNLLSRDTAISEETAGKTTKREHRYGDGAVQVIGAELYDAAGRPVIELQSLQRYKLVFRIRAYEPVQDVVFGILLRDRRGLDLFGWDTQTQGIAPLPPMQVGDEQELTLRFHANLGGGTYFVTPALARGDGHKYDVRYDALELSVRRTDSIFTTSLVNLDVAVE